MGQARTDHVNADLTAVEKEVDQLRDRTQHLIVELERRVHDTVARANHTVERVKHAVDLPAQVREHPRVAAGIGAGTVVALGVSLWLLVSHRRAARRPMARLQRKAHALRMILADPEQLLRRRAPRGRSLLTTVLAAAATALVIGVMTRRAV